MGKCDPPGTLAPKELLCGSSSVELYVAFLGIWERKKATELSLQSWEDLDGSTQAEMT